MLGFFRRYRILELIDDFGQMYYMPQKKQVVMVQGYSHTRWVNMLNDTHKTRTRSFAKMVIDRDRIKNANKIYRRVINYPW